MTKLDDMMARIQGLLANADDPANPPEAQQSYRDKAEALMFKYKIDALTAPEAVGIKPIAVDFVVSRMGSEYGLTYRYLLAMVARHVGGKAAYDYDYESRTVKATLVAFESDARYAQLLFTAAALAFGNKMEPTLTDDMTDADKCFVLRQAGIEGGRVALRVFGVDNKTTRSKVRRIADAEATRRGEPVMSGIDVKAFRDAYAAGFVNHLHDRLWRLRQTRGADSSGLVLANADQAVADMFYDMFPHLKPREPIAVIENAECAKCKKAKSGYCREHAPRSYKGSSRQFSDAGYTRGQASARSVDLGPGATPRLGN